MESMDGRVARCLLIAKVLTADGFVTEEERMLLEVTMDALGLGPELRRQVRALEGWHEAEAVVTTLPVTERQAILDSLVQAVLADGRVSPHEMEAVQKISKALGL